MRSSRTSSTSKLVVAGLLLLIASSASGESSNETERKDDRKDMGAVKNVMGYMPDIKESSERTGVPAAVIASTMEHESGGRKLATSYHTASKDYTDRKGNEVKKGDFTSFKDKTWNGVEYKKGDLVHRLSELKGDVVQKNGKTKFTWLSAKRPSYPAQIARGLMQCIESTAKAPGYGGYAFDDLYDPKKSIDCGARVLADLNQEIGGTWEMGPIAAGYFSGKSNALPAKTGVKNGKPYTPGKSIRKYMATAERLLSEWEERLK